MKKFLEALLALFSRKERTRQQIRKVVNAIRRAIENPAFDVVTELTQTRVDNEILAAARALLRELAAALADGETNARLSATEAGGVAALKQLTEGEKRFRLRQLEDSLTQQFV